MQHELKITVEDPETSEEIYKGILAELKEEGFQIKSAEESIPSGITDVELVITIVISLATSITANRLDKKLNRH
jgi:hypothetical protein